MKLIIQIPCYNEEENLPAVLQSLPRHLEGIDQIEVLVVDDGSRDGTSQAARECGADHILRFRKHRGLASAFRTGLDAALRLGADLILNTDADNQYPADQIPLLLEPLLAGRADMSIGDRGVANQKHFSPLKRFFQITGSWVIAGASGMQVPDAASGFRAMTREAALRTVVLSEYSYTLESLIQAGAHKLAVEYVPIRTNPDGRPSRLMRGLGDYLLNSGVTIMRAYTLYRPLRVFSIVGSVIFMLGLILAGRYLYFYLSGQGGGHVQSVVLAAVLLIIGLQVGLIGLLADLISFNRKMLEEVLYLVKKGERGEAADLKSREP
jgi:glycosyltransferase involved in cell wall biosynthesis